MVLEGMITGLKQSLSGFGINVVSFVPNLILALILLLIGFLLGKFTKWILKKILVNGLKLKDLLKFGIVDITLTIIKWAIYIFFIHAAIVVLEIPILSQYLSTVLGIIPGLIGSVVILVAGYAIARYLKTGVEKTRMKNWALLSNILFLFVLYISTTLAIRASFMGYDELANNIILIITAVGAAAIAWNYRDFLKRP